MSDQDLPPGQCVCGRPLPDNPLSDWACSEPCQSAWMMHHANPGYPHPRDIRAAADAAAAALTPPGPGGLIGPGRPGRYARGGMVPDGTEINVDGECFVRVGTHWRPAGLWTPLRDGYGDTCRYRRWCPHCAARRDSLIYPATDRQECTQCGHQWDGRPLLGQIDTRALPWPGMRMLLYDGQRSTVRAFTQHEIELTGDRMPQRIGVTWLRLERQLCGGYADIDQPSPAQQRQAARRMSRAGNYCTGMA